MPETRDILFLTWTLTGNKEWRAEHPYREGWYFVLICKIGNQTWYVKRVQDGPGDFFDYVDDSPSFHHATASASAKLLTQAMHDAWRENCEPARQWMEMVTEAVVGLPKAVEAITRSRTGGLAGGCDDPDTELHEFMQSVPLHVHTHQAAEIRSLDDSMRKPEAASA